MRGGNGSASGGGGDAQTTKNNLKDTSFKYSKEYMLSLYTSDKQASVDIKHHEHAVVNESQNPLSPLNKDISAFSSFENNTLTGKNITVLIIMKSRMCNCYYQ